METGWQIEFWHWWILAAGFLILEAIAPGAIFLWLGVSAIVVGGILMIFTDMSWELQIFIFSVLSVVSATVWRLYFRREPAPSDHPNLNQRGHRYIGRIFTLDEPITNGVGMIRVDDTTWRINGDDLPAGARVQVSDVDGATLKVVRAE